MSPQSNLGPKSTDPFGSIRTGIMNYPSTKAESFCPPRTSLPSESSISLDEFVFDFRAPTPTTTLESQAAILDYPFGNISFNVGGAQGGNYSNSVDVGCIISRVRRIKEIVLIESVIILDN